MSRKEPAGTGAGAGRPITEVAMLLGHGSPATTMAIYAHWIRQDVGAAAEALSRFYGR